MAHKGDKHRSSKDGKTHKKNTPKYVDFNPNLKGADLSDKKKKSAKKIHRNSPKPKQLVSDIDANAVPDPEPDTGVTRTYIYYTQTPVYTGLLPAIPTSTPGFSPVPPLASFATVPPTSTAATGTSQSYPSSNEPTPTLNDTALQASPTQGPKHMAVAEIVVIAIGGAFVLFGIFAATWICTRPKKRSHPVPSLPILHEDYVERKEEADEESLFGGKERTSARPGSNGILYNWTKYPHVSMSQKSFAKTEVSNAVAVTTSKRASTVLGETGYPFEGYGATAPEPAEFRPPLQQQLQAALSKAANRVSAMSMSIYPASPQTNVGGYTDIGVALGGYGDHASDHQRNDSRSAKRRSVATTEQLDGYTSGRTSLAPPLPAHNAQSSGGGGRMPVKGPYAPTASMRSSASLARVASTSRRSMAFDPSQYPLPSHSPITKTDACRERETQALTSALGLDTQAPPSPQTTIHPDDSITLAGDRRRSRNLGHARQRSSVMSPTIEASARLGNLMLAEFQSMTSLPSTRAVPQSTDNKSQIPPLRKKTDDKPPRVPSPPPLPSLAQMALAHTSDYNDYRSPTYSIYGLYEAERKSRGY